MQAATGAVSYQIKLQMKKLGLTPNRIGAEGSTEGGGSGESEKRDWVLDFIDGKYDQAKATLENEKKGQSGEDALESEAWILYCELKLRDDGSTDAVTRFASKHLASSHIQAVAATILRHEGHVNKAIELLSVVQSQRPKDPAIAMALAICHRDQFDDASEIAELQRVGPDDFPKVAISLAEAFERNENNYEALEVVKRSYAKHPTNKDLRYKYARLAQDLDQHCVAAHLLDRLTHDNPKSIEYWGYLGNSCIQLELEDQALYAYRRAESLMTEGDASQWITANIGNLLTHRGLPTEACKYLERAVKYEPHSEYAHDRLASALKAKTTASKEFEKKCIEGQREVREAVANALNPSSTIEPNVLRERLSIPALTQDLPDV
jgi:predicted Zn-dependent protease